MEHVSVSVTAPVKGLAHRVAAIARVQMNQCSLTASVPPVDTQSKTVSWLEVAYTALRSYTENILSFSPA